MTHLLDITDHSADWLLHVLATARRLRDQYRTTGHNEPILCHKTLALYFEKPSLRTRVSFEQAMNHLGGAAIMITQNEVQLGLRESVGDFTRVMAGMVDAIAARVYDHALLKQMADCDVAPVINMLSDRSHPCQALADVLSMQDEFGDHLGDRTVAFVGDANNVARSLGECCALLGMRFILASPREYAMKTETLQRIERLNANAAIEQVTDPKQAVREADVIYCDTFVSMGQESETELRLKKFAPYQLNAELLALAPNHAIVMHCLPAHRGLEITDQVMDGPQSRVFAQAHNRLHAQKGLLAVLLGQ